MSDFASLPETARLWIYQTNRKITVDETNQLTQALDNFITEWSAHGKKLQAGFEILYNHFVIIGVDENSMKASGCSIDASVHFLKKLEQQLEIDFFRRDQLAIKSNDVINLLDIKALQRKEASINSGTLIFNNLISTKSDLNDNWIIPASKSWVSKYIS